MSVLRVNSGTFPSLVLADLKWRESARERKIRAEP